jgi:hypothetical protein
MRQLRLPASRCHPGRLLLRTLAESILLCCGQPQGCEVTRQLSRLDKLGARLAASEGRPWLVEGSEALAGHQLPPTHSRARFAPTSTRVGLAVAVCARVFETMVAGPAPRLALGLALLALAIGATAR